jgi:hypothetical protein
MSTVQWALKKNAKRILEKGKKKCANLRSWIFFFSVA